MSFKKLMLPDGTERMFNLQQVTVVEPDPNNKDFFLVFFVNNQTLQVPNSLLREVMDAMQIL